MAMKIITEIERPSADIVKCFNALFEYESPACAVSDAMERFNAMGPDIRPAFEGIRVAGVAVTAQCISSDLAGVLKAIDVAKPGDIIIVDTYGSKNTVFWGENVSMSAKNRGIVASIIDGPTRDIEEIRRLRFPVLSRGTVPNAGSITGYGQVNVPIQCGGAPVNPGDIIFVDSNGVVVVPRLNAETILSRTKHILDTENIVQDKIEAGATIGELINIDSMFATIFAYQERATKK